MKINFKITILLVLNSEQPIISSGKKEIVDEKEEKTISFSTSNNFDVLAAKCTSSQSI